MPSDPLDVSSAIAISRGTVRKTRQNLAWAVGYNSLALPIAAGVFAPLGFTLRPEIGTISMSGSSVLVALNALALKRLRFPGTTHDAQTSEERASATAGGSLPRNRPAVYEIAAVPPVTPTTRQDEASYLTV